MTDSVTSSAVAVGDVAKVRARETQLAVLFRKAKAPLRADTDLERALSDVVDTPTIGAVAAVEMARQSSGWSVKIGSRNGLVRFEAFARALVAGGWFLERKAPRVSSSAAYEIGDPVGSVRAMLVEAYPDLSAADRLRLYRALIQSLAHTLGPDGIPPEPEDLPDDGRLGKREVLERRVTTIATSVLKAGEAPAYDMNWRSTVFLRTKEGKDKPKDNLRRTASGHRLFFNLERWRDGDRSALLGYYSYVEDWFGAFNSSGGRTRSMACFAAVLED